jgi:hypothetical protein
MNLFAMRINIALSFEMFLANIAFEASSASYLAAGAI